LHALTFAGADLMMRYLLRAERMSGFARRSTRLWRPLVGIVVAYTVAAQSLLIAFGGFGLPANAGTDIGAFEFCHHGGQTTPDQPVGPSGPAGCSHCIFCFAISQNAFIGPSPAIVHRFTESFVSIAWVADRTALPRLSAYSIASPRGPPLPA